MYNSVKGPHGSARSLTQQQHNTYIDYITGVYSQYGSLCSYNVTINN